MAPLWTMCHGRRSSRSTALTYTDRPIFKCLHNYNQTPVMPVFLMEAHYELERVGGVSDYGTPPVLRREEYWAMLSGGKGQFYGNFYTWSFASGWKYYIDTPGAAQVTHLEKLLFWVTMAGSCSGSRPFGTHCRTWKLRRPANPGQHQRLCHRLQDPGWRVCGCLHANRTNDHGEYGESEGARKCQVV